MHAEAAKALGELKDARAVGPLIAMLKDEDIDMRRVAAEALGKIGDVRVVEPLIAALKIGGSKVREVADDALEKIGWRPGKDEDGAAYWIAKENWEECATIGAPAVEPLIAVLKKRRFMSGPMKALGKIGDARAVEPLISLLEENRSFSPGYFPDDGLLGKFGFAMNKEAFNALERIGIPGVELLIAALKDNNWRLRCCAAILLGKIGDGRAVKPLTSWRSKLKVGPCTKRPSRH